MPATMWTNHQRIHQYQGGHNERWGGATIDIDNDQLDAALGGPAPLPARAGFRVAAARNVSKSAEWFARAADHTLVHDYQHLTGSHAWSGIKTVGNSPDNIASNPAVAPDANGDLNRIRPHHLGPGSECLAAAQRTGRLAVGRPGGRSGSPGAITRDPGAARRPGGDVEVFVTRSGGALRTTSQTAPNADSSWTPWQGIGGSCASSPVPLRAHGGLAVFCITKAGTAAVDRWRRGSWHGWNPVGTSPAGLTANPPWCPTRPARPSCSRPRQPAAWTTPGRVRAAGPGGRRWPAARPASRSGGPRRRSAGPMARSGCSPSWAPASSG